MIIRIVKLELRPEEVEGFIAFFQTVKTKIRAVEGCAYLAMWQDAQDPSILFTCSHWEAAVDLENYRQSELFKNSWKKAKSLFRGKPLAWSLQQVTEVV